jgi:hypothetical protein
MIGRYRSLPPAMSDSEASTTARWPNVPACYGWLSLDRRGIWRLQGEPVAHAGLIGFLNRHYATDGAGNWFVQNGPQRVFVRLDYTPLVLRLQPDGSLTAHTGAAAGPAEGVYIDEEGSVLVHAAPAVGLLDDRDLAAFVDACRHGDGTPAGEAALLEAMAGAGGVSWNGLPVRAIARREVPTRFGFEPAPAPAP